MLRVLETREVASRQGPLRLTAATNLELHDKNLVGSTWSLNSIPKLSALTAEWNLFKTNFGEVSLLNALNQAYSTASNGALGAVVKSDFAAIGTVTNLASVTLDSGTATPVIGNTVLVHQGTSRGVYILDTDNHDGTWGALQRAASLSSNSQCGSREILVSNGRYWGNKVFAQRGSTLSASTYSCVDGPQYAAMVTPLVANSGAATLLTIPISVSTDVTVTVTWNSYDGSSGSTASRVSGSASIRVSRGSGAAGVVKSAVFDAEFVDTTTTLLTPWNPTSTLSGNNVLVTLTADKYNPVIPECHAVVDVRSNADAPAQPLVAAMALVLADTPVFLLYADTGKTPALPNIGDSITAWADQSGNNHSVAGVAAHYPTYGVDAGGYPYLQFTGDEANSAGSQRMLVATLPTSSTSHTFRWKGVKDNNASSTAAVLFNSNSNVWIVYHMGATAGSIGTNISIYDGTGYHILATCPSGKHNFELRLNGAATTVNGVPANSAAFYIDGGLVNTVAYAPTTLLSSNLEIGALNGSYGMTSKIYGIDYEASVGTDAKMNHWIAASEIAWGAHA